jgi:hypothetical protein
MKRIAHASIALVATLVLTAGSVAMGGATKSGKGFTLFARVQKVDLKARTMLVSEYGTKQNYLVIVPEGAGIRIAFGRWMNLAYPTLGHVDKNNWIRVRVRRTEKERLARLDDGSSVVVLTAAH